MSVSVIIAAGGLGARFTESLKTFSACKRSALPKLFWKLGRFSLIERALSCFLDVREVREIVIVAPREYLRLIQSRIREMKQKRVCVVPGGATRSRSVLAGMRALKTKSRWVLIHDGARPLLSPGDLCKVLRWARARKQGAAVLAQKVIPTLKEACPGQRTVLRTIDRTRMWEAQTPQIFSRNYLERAFQSAPMTGEMTDEAMMMEKMGVPVHLIEGADFNPKITTFQDWKLAQGYTGEMVPQNLRIGYGKDSHRLCAGRRFMLGGIQIKAPFGPLGHSDGDALLHALTDAILGGAGMGDIGEHFSDRSPQFKNVASGKILKNVMQRVVAEGWKVLNVDTVVSLEHPRLSAYKEKIRRKIAGWIDVDPKLVSVKAKTAEGLGPVGKGLSVEAEAVVLLLKTQ